MADEFVLATSGIETERWFDNKDFGHEIPRDLWDEWEKLWERITELDSQFSNFPFIDHRQPRELTDQEKIFRRYLVPDIRSSIYSAIPFMTRRVEP